MSHTPPRRTTSPTAAACSPRLPARVGGCWPMRSTAARPDFIDAALAYVRFALDHPGHYAVMFDRSLVNPDDPELNSGPECGGRGTGAGVGTLKDPRAKADPQSAALAAWSLVHGFVDASAQRGDRNRRRSDGGRREDRADAVRRLMCERLRRRSPIQSRTSLF